MSDEEKDLPLTTNPLPLPDAWREHLSRIAKSRSPKKLKALEASRVKAAIANKARWARWRQQYRDREEAGLDSKRDLE